MSSIFRNFFSKISYLSLQNIPNILGAGLQRGPLFLILLCYCLRTGSSFGLKKACAIPMPKMYTLASTKIFSFFNKSVKKNINKQKETGPYICFDCACCIVKKAHHRFSSGIRREAEGWLQQTLQRDDITLWDDKWEWKRWLVEKKMTAYLHHL